MKFRYQIILAILITSLIVSIIISLTPAKIICNPEEGCDTVLSSSYSKTAGIANSVLGAGIFLLMSFVTLSHIRKPHKHKKLLISIGILFGALIALYFIYLQAFVLNAWCKYCMIVDTGLIVALIVINLPQKKEKIKAEIEPRGDVNVN